MPKFSVSMDDDVLRLVDDFAACRGVSRSAAISMMCRVYHDMDERVLALLSTSHIPFPSIPCPVVGLDRFLSFYHGIRVGLSAPLDVRRAALTAVNDGDSD